MLQKSDIWMTTAAYSHLGDCDILMITAARPSSNVSSSDEWMTSNLQLLSRIQQDIGKYASNKILISATNPSDVCTYYHYKNLGWDRSKIIGFCVNDSVRVRWALSIVMGLDYKEIDALCIGEHGPKQVPLWDKVTYRGKPLEVPVELREKAYQTIDAWTTEFLTIADARTTGWLSCISLSQLVADIAQGSKRPISVTTPLDGEYGQKGICLGVPAILGPNGVEKIVEMELSPSESADFQEAATKVRGLLKDAGI